MKKESSLILCGKRMDLVCHLAQKCWIESPSYQKKTGLGDEFEIIDILYSKILAIQSNPSNPINTKIIKLRGEIKYYKMKKAM
jgi:hypothetical protein